MPVGYYFFCVHSCVWRVISRVCYGSSKLIFLVTMEVETIEHEKKSVFLPELLSQFLPIYYKRLFPYNYYYRWLSYGNIDKKYFINREFSFTINGDVYIRYQSFNDQADMEKELQKNNPEKIDIGAVFNYKPRHSKSISNFSAKEKELVFDIDMTDYDEVRTCCSGADICSRCWPFMTIAMKIIDRALRDDFGYQHLLWVYSGRRGVHCWVCDDGARKLTEPERSAITQYLSLIKGGSMRQKKVFLPEKIHPSIDEALHVIDAHFENLMIENQDFLSKPEEIEAVASLASDTNLKKSVLEELKLYTSTADRWKGIKSRFDKFNGHNKNTHYIQEVMLQMCYPRLDVAVSKGLNHLLKSPFSIHPKTGRVCVPIDITTVDTFDPFQVPTINELCDELDHKEQDMDSAEDKSNGKKLKTLKQTRLSSSILVFKKFIENLELTWKGKLLEESDKRKEF